MSETIPRSDNPRQARGEKNGRAKLTARLVARARALFRQDPKKYSAEALAITYGVSRFVMWAALTGRTWKHVSNDRDAAETTATDAEPKADA